MTIEQAFRLALELQQAGRLAEAEAICRQILAAQPQHAEVENLRGELQRLGHGRAVATGHI